MFALNRWINEIEATVPLTDGEERIMVGRRSESDHRDAGRVGGSAAVMGTALRNIALP